MESRDYSDQSKAEEIVKQGATTEIGKSDLKVRPLYYSGLRIYWHIPIHDRTKILRITYDIDGAVYRESKELFILLYLYIDRLYY